MTNCSDFGELISAALDGELGADDQDRLEQHLESCDRCRGEAQSFGHMGQLLAASRLPIDLETPPCPTRASQPPRWSRGQFGLRVAGWSTAALILIGLTIAITVRPQNADARTLAEPLETLQAINRMHDMTYRSALKTCEWDLRALKLELQQLDLQTEQEQRIRERIDSLLNRIQASEQPTHTSGRTQS